jgi:heme/copper-type cytochrome/quinol oxidase subunit 3
MVLLVSTMQGWAVCLMASQFIGDVIVTLRSASLGVTGASLCLFVLALLCLWRENSVDNANGGVNSSTEQSSLEACVCLIILMEVWLFGGPLWVIVADHVSSSGLDSVPRPSITTQFHRACYGSCGNGWSNSLTIGTSNLLFGSGVLLVAALHRWSGGAYAAGAQVVALVVALGSVFVATQCVEYAHLHFTVTSCGGPGNFYILTCLHGSHVLVGLCVLITSAYLGGLSVFLTGFTQYEGSSSAGLLAVSLY